MSFEFVAQVIQRVGLAVCVSTEGGAGGGDKILKVGDGVGQAAAKSGQLVAQGRDGLKSLG
ncbi:MAG TPA: hypothetical protein VGH27_30805 [Streptosporangiaceae bacterium]